MKMNLRQRFLKAVYPVFVLFKKILGDDKTLMQAGEVAPPVPFHGLSAELNDGRKLSFSSLKNKKVLIVNTASNCGYTNQYAELQKLYEHTHDDLEIIAFPANDFKEQEKGTDQEIAQFCQVNFGVSFLLARKSTVVKTAAQNAVFKWLTQKDQNGWNDKEPSWNFSKYLVNEEGILTHYFEPAVSPMSEEVIKAVNA